MTVLFNEKPGTQFCLLHSHLGLSGEDSANGISGPEYDIIIRRFLLFPTPSELKAWQYIVSFIELLQKKDVTLS